MTSTSISSEYCPVFPVKDGETPIHCQSVTWLWCASCGCVSGRPAYYVCACCGRPASELQAIDEQTMLTRLAAIRARRWGRLSPSQHEARHDLAEMERDG